MSGSQISRYCTPVGRNSATPFMKPVRSPEGGSGLSQHINRLATAALAVLIALYPRPLLNNVCKNPITFLIVGLWGCTPLSVQNLAQRWRYEPYCLRVPSRHSARMISQDSSGKPVVPRACLKDMSLPISDVGVAGESCKDQRAKLVMKLCMAT